jgi:hypothetical protein
MLYFYNDLQSGWEAYSLTPNKTKWGNFAYLWLYCTLYLGHCVLLSARCSSFAPKIVVGNRNLFGNRGGESLAKKKKKKKVMLEIPQHRCNPLVRICTTEILEDIYVYIYTSQKREP